MKEQDEEEDDIPLKWEQELDRYLIKGEDNEWCKNWIKLQKKKMMLGLLNDAQRDIIEKL